MARFWKMIIWSWITPVFRFLTHAIWFTMCKQNCAVFGKTDHFSERWAAYFPSWIILIITYSSLRKNYSSKLIMTLETLGNVLQMSEIVSWMIGVRYDQNHSWIIWSQSTPFFEILLILNNRAHWNASLCVVWRLNI